MSRKEPQRPAATTASDSPVVSRGFDRTAVGALAVGLALLYVPTYIDLARTVWATDEQGHGPIILAISFWLMWCLRDDYLALTEHPAWVSGALTLAFGFAAYVLGRTQQLDTVEVASQIFVLIGALLILKGWSAVRLMAFPLFFMIFMVPLPSILVQVVTVPLKTAVSLVAETVLYEVGYPVSRTGVIITVGQYQLLVADACAGLNSMFTLEALGLLYLNLMNYTSVMRKVLLATLVIPVSFIANVVRVMILVLVTYHFGDAAGQGFVHGFAGMVLFLVALMLILVVDRVLGLVVPGGGGNETAARA